MMTPYNGWTNYPSWAVHLWLTNDEPMYHAARAAVLDIAEDDAPAALRQYVEDLPNVAGTLESAGIAADLLGWALDTVNWAEIAAALTTE